MGKLNKEGFGVVPSLLMEEGGSHFMLENEEIRFTGIFVTHQPRVQPEERHSLGHSRASIFMDCLREEAP